MDMVFLMMALYNNSGFVAPRVSFVQRLVSFDTVLCS